MKILFIGGNGNISWYCVQTAIERGHEVWELNRGVTTLTRRNIQPEVHVLKGDIRNIEEVKKVLNGTMFDVVFDFICFNRKHAVNDINIFTGITKHFMFISSESVYLRNSKNIPFQECCEKNNIETSSEYVVGKIEAEEQFMKAYIENKFPVTIIRPAYTYDVIIPVSIGHNCFTAPQKYLEGFPALIAGDGINLWTFTHSSDFASALIPLAENPETIGEDFHIANDEWLTWKEETEILLHTLGIKSPQSIHIPYEEALQLEDFQPRDLMFQRMWHNIYDTKKVKQYVSGWRAKMTFEEGIKQTIHWLNHKEIRRRIVPEHDRALNKLYDRYMRN